MRTPRNFTSMRILWIILSLAGLVSLSAFISVAATPYSDKNGYFIFDPPEGWERKDYTDDPRSKVVFKKEEAELSFIASAHEEPTPLRQVLLGASSELRSQIPGARVEAIRMSEFNGMPAVEVIFHIKERKFKKVLFYYHGNVFINLTILAPIDRFAEIESELVQSLKTFRPNPDFLRGRTTEARNQELHGYLRRADISMQSGALKQAEQELASALEISPGNPEILLRFATLYYLAGRYEEAIKTAEQALAEFRSKGAPEKEGGTLLIIGATYVKLGEPRKALQAFQSALATSRVLKKREPEVQVLKEIGELYAQMSDFDQAQGYLEDALKIARELKNKELHGPILTGLGNVLSARGEQRKALEIFRERLDLAREMRDFQGELATLTNIGYVLTNLGDFQGGLDNFQKALARIKEAEASRRELFGGVGPSILRRWEGKVLTGMGGVFERMGDSKRAREYFEQRLAIARETKDQEGEFSALLNISNLDLSNGQTLKALESLHVALSMTQKLQNRRAEATVLSNVGNVFLMIGNYPQALERYRAALTIFEKIGDRRGMSMARHNIGNVFQMLGDYREALKAYQNILEILQELGIKSEQIKTLVSAASVFLELGDHKKGIEYLRDALTTAKEIGAKQEIVNVLTHIGRAYYDLGEYAWAAENLDQALKLAEQVGESLSVGNIASLVQGLVDAYIARGELAKAKKLLRALEDPFRWGTYFLVLKEYQVAADYFSVAAEKIPAFVGAGRAFEGLKRWDKAWESYNKARQLVEEARGQLGERERERFLSAGLGRFSHIGSYEGLVEVAWHLRTKNEEAFLFAEHTKARSLNEILALRQFRKGTTFGLPFTLAQKENQLEHQMSALLKLKKQAIEKGNLVAVKNLTRELDQLKKEQEAFIHDLRRTHPAYAAIRFPQPVRAKDIPLHANETLFEYEVTDEATYLFVIKNKKVKAFLRIPLARVELEGIIRDFLRPFNDRSLTEFSPTKAHKLYRLLLAEGLRHVSSEDHLIIVPDEVLALLPFEALVVDPAQLTYLVDHRQVSYYQSAATLTIVRQTAKKKKWTYPLFAVGDPVFGPEDERVIVQAGQQEPTSPESVDALRAIFGTANMRDRVKEREYNLERLRGTGLEVGNIGKIFGLKPAPPHFLLGHGAQEKAVKGMDLSRYRYLHFATHGVLGDDIPYLQESAVVFSLVDTGGEDGFLTATEIMELNLGSDLVVLSACQTGLGSQVKGEGILGLTRAIMYAGSPSVVVSLWSVADEPTADFMASFYNHLEKGKSKRDALHLAKREFRKSNTYAHPFFWAAFILVGDS